MASTSRTKTIQEIDDLSEMLPAMAALGISCKGLKTVDPAAAHQYSYSYSKAKDCTFLLSASSFPAIIKFQPATCKTYVPILKFVLEILCKSAESFRGITFFARCNPWELKITTYFHIQMSSPKVRAPIKGHSTVNNHEMFIHKANNLNGGLVWYEVRVKCTSL